VTTDANEMVADIHDRMPAILAPADYARWLSDEPDPRDLLRPFPADLMRMWPISTRVNKPENDDPSIIEAVEMKHTLLGHRVDMFNGLGEKLQRCREHRAQLLSAVSW